MKITKRTKREVEELASRFIRNSPPLCKEHMPEGLPIDAPEDIEISEHHPSYKFEKLVERELNQSSKAAVEEEVLRSQIRGNLRSAFAEIFYSNSDERSCIQCYEERKESDSGVDIRMDVPEEYDDIGDR